MTTFENLNLSAPLLDAIKSEGYTEPTPVQAQAIPLALDGKDLFGCARTGTGKTAAFALPLLQKLSEGKPDPKRPRALILAPTRELAQQISDSFRTYGKNLRIQHTAVYGGVPQRKQVASLKRGSDIVIATPGRLLDLMQQRHVQLDAIKYLVLDEADRMLDMGFIPDIRRICTKVPDRRQTMLFSATLPHAVKKLAASLLKDPKHVDIKPDPEANSGTTKERVFFVSGLSKADLLRHVIKTENINQALVFTRTKRGADKLAKRLGKQGVRARAMHGDKSQKERSRTLNQFKDRKVHILVATDVVARGIDVDDLPHVFNYDIPDQPETYTHRIGRTGRAGQDGAAYSFCTRAEKGDLRAIERLRGTAIPVVAEHPFKPSPHADKLRSGGRRGGRRMRRFSGHSR